MVGFTNPTEYFCRFGANQTIYLTKEVNFAIYNVSKKQKQKEFTNFWKKTVKTLDKKKKNGYNTRPRTLRLKRVVWVDDMFLESDL